MFSPIVLTPIGIVHSPHTEPLDHAWGGVLSRIELDATRFQATALSGLTDFSHIEVVFAFHLVEESRIHYGSRHPRGRKDWPEVGIFAQRGRERPNRIGVTTCRLLGVSGLTLEVEGLDAIDGTPVVDIKPYVAEFGPRGEVRQAAWMHELMGTYWKT
jgi:tRNA-Thr(GGU) m(6)t(6)A37 methyltransferase TsaA